MRTVVFTPIIAILFAPAVATAAAPPIGLAIANGDFTLDSQPVPGNATIFEGSTIETLEAASRVSLRLGTRIEIANASRGVFHRNYFKLEKGITQVETSTPYEIQALSFKIVPERTASARVSITGPDSVRVAALTGTFQVSNYDGVLVASLSAGRSLEFSPQAEAGAAAPARMSGCLTKLDGRYWLTDSTANVTAELKGGDLESRAGSQVEVLGTMRTAQSTPVLSVLRVNLLSQSCWRRDATAASASASASAEKPSVLGMTPSHAVIAGVGIAAAAAIPAIVLTSGSDPKTLSPSSR